VEYAATVGDDGEFARATEWTGEKTGKLRNGAAVGSRVFDAIDDVDL